MWQRIARAIIKLNRDSYLLKIATLFTFYEFSFLPLYVYKRIFAYYIFRSHSLRFTVTFNCIRRIYSNMRVITYWPESGLNVKESG